jgi:hypothetical protein
MSRLFDPVSLLNENIAANATKREPLPIGETVAQIMELSTSEGVSGPNSKNPGTPWARLDLKLEITDPEYLAQIPGTPTKATTFLGVMLDMQNGSIATGPNKNIRLGRLREAAGANGKPLSAMQGAFLRIAIGHKPHPTDPEGGVVDEIVSYTKA